MIRAIVSQRWDADLQQYVTVPLDDSEPWVIEANSRFAGTDFTGEQVQAMLQEPSTLHSKR